ncbi:MAG: DUF3276 family protein [Bacteroidetes bacterium]|nr:DUF3276 family protein [Bacteroidota bacterium]
MEGYEKKENERERDEIFSKAIRAGRRTYFFDVKATRKNDYYLTITESKKQFDQDGRFHFEKHKLFLYKEDFEKFAEGLTEVVDYIKETQPQIIEESEEEKQLINEFTNLKFEDLKDDE